MCIGSNLALLSKQGPDMFESFIDVFPRYESCSEGYL
jgi:hypothetical protein